MLVLISDFKKVDTMKKTNKHLLGSLLVLASVFLGCEENTTEPIITDISSIYIDTNISKIYATDPAISLSATVIHTDTTRGDASNAVTWASSDPLIASLEENVLTGGVQNGGEVTLSISYEDFDDSISLEVIKLVDFEISHNDITTTGEHILEAKGFFEDNTSARVIAKNISWDANNSATFTTTDNVTTIDIKAGSTLLKATLFAENDEINITKSVLYTIK